jgi:hypothetical protein
MSGASGIDRASSVADVQEAFRRLGAELRLEPSDGGWQARVVAQGHEHLTATGDDAPAVARAAWAEFVRRTQGTGES